MNEKGRFACHETGDPIDMVCIMLNGRHKHYPPKSVGTATVAMEDIDPSIPPDKA